jgi:hypothetical protein
MRFRDKIGTLHDPILKPANLPDFLAVARSLPGASIALRRISCAGVMISFVGFHFSGRPREGPLWPASSRSC